MQMPTFIAMVLVNRSTIFRWGAKALIGVLLAATCFAKGVQADPGDLDTSFGFDGKVTTGFSVDSDEEAEAIVIQSDGKIVAAGVTDADGTFDFALARYNTDGILDESFGSDGTGMVLTDFGGGSDEAAALAIQSDGKIVAAGVTDSNGTFDFALARYTAEGNLDVTFGKGGTVVTDFIGGSFDESHALAIQSDGKIVAAGISDADGSLGFALARYNADGTLDEGFGIDGLVFTDLGDRSVEGVNALAIQSDGKIVAAGNSNAEGSIDFALAQYNADGSLDESFGTGGFVLTDFSGSGSIDQAKALIIQSDGKMVVAGRSDASGNLDVALARYNTDGIRDNGFGSGGVVLTDFGGSFEQANALAIQSDGKIVAAGISDAGGTGDFALALYNIDGILDESFGLGGLVFTDFRGGSIDPANALAIQSDGKIVAAGSSVTSGNEDFALARYLDSVPVPTPSPTPMPAVEPGDANADGEINILDVTTILNDILGVSPAPGNGDCNEDLMVNILDVTCVLNIILGS